MSGAFFALVLLPLGIIGLGIVVYYVSRPKETGGNNGNL